jgi:hypothetical protein
VSRGCEIVKPPSKGWVRLPHFRVWFTAFPGIVPKRADNAIFKLTLGKIQPAPS